MTFSEKINKLRNIYGERVDLCPIWFFDKRRDDYFIDRLVCMLDLYHLAKNILGHHDMVNLHKRIADDVAEEVAFAKSDLLRTCITLLSV